MTPTRRGFLAGLVSLVAAPAIVSPMNLMPINPRLVVPPQGIIFPEPPPLPESFFITDLNETIDGVHVKLAGVLAIPLALLAPSRGDLISYSISRNDRSRVYEGIAGDRFRAPAMIERSAEFKITREGAIYLGLFDKFVAGEPITLQLEGNGV